MPNLYGILKISSDASQTEVRAAYKRQALQAHPDKGGSSWAFQQVVAAFEQLADPLLRQAYDERCQKINLRSFDKSGVVLKRPRKAYPEKGLKKAHPKVIPKKKVSTSATEKKKSWKQRFLAKVVKRLKVLLPEDRKMVFECRLVQAQRLELEAFMKETRVEAPLEATKSGASKVMRNLGFRLFGVQRHGFIEYFAVTLYLEGQVLHFFVIIHRTLMYGFLQAIDHLANLRDHSIIGCMNHFLLIGVTTHLWSTPLSSPKHPFSKQKRGFFSYCCFIWGDVFILVCPGGVLLFHTFSHGL